ncbi:S8 family serine peptidase [Streptomyces sp. SBC-4]|nr:S8 family serine peptidase [Streptomyces sp. SBC-4]MDV5142757.1 S8 family serine peptidase [Streptomyces sp. SBC-4]
MAGRVTQGEPGPQRPQIGADKAWESGFDGTGVKIAVLDTGVDKTHDDLRTQVVDEKNFSPSPDAVDRVGHGTHVASIAVGTGAKSGGKYKGVAPGAKVISGKVLGRRGLRDDSAIIAAWSGPPPRAPTSSTSASATVTAPASTRWRRR